MKLIVVEDGARTALEFDKNEIKIGRAIDNDIRLSGQHASRHHCRIEQGKETWIHDQGSANGIQVNGVDLMKWNEAGQVTEFKVMLRPLKAVTLIHERMAAMLAALAPKA